jgi:twitching motility protein PilT
MGVNEKKLIIRIQPISPPSLTHILKDHPKLIETLTSASGLVVLCGPVGSGKTTTAAALVSHWANRRSKHIATIEDPVEYIITPQAGEVTHMSCNLLGQDRPEGVPDLRRLLATLVRGDIDGLFIGEIRDSETRRVCLAHAATSEPVVTTIHAGGIGHAALRLTGSEPGVTEGEQGFLRLSLTQCLHTIIYINLAYNEKGEAVPVVIAAPAKMTALRNAIVSSDPKTLTNQVNQAVLTVTDEEGGISPARAMASARALGATEASIIAALPGDLRALMNQSR